MPLGGEQVSGDLMRNAELFQFDIAQGPLGFGGDFEDLGEFARHEQHVDEDSEVVDEAGEIGALGLRIVEFAGEIAGNKSAGQGVLPEGSGIPLAVPGGRDLHEAAGSDDVTQAVDAEREGGGAQGADSLAQSEQRRVGHVEDLGTQSAIVGNQLDGLLQIDVVGVAIELIENREQDGGKRWQLVESLTRR